MKVIRILITLLLFIMTPLAALAAPKLVMTDQEVRIARPAIEGETVRGVFQVSNEGDRDLIIKVIEPG